jgi:hypothetical protein
MRTGSLPRSIAAALPPSTEYHFAPDGLDIAAIDELIAQAYSEADADRLRPTWTGSDVAGRRRMRRNTRQVVRALPTGLNAARVHDEEAA